MERKMSEQKKQAIIEQLWLTYFNDTLYEKGLITEDQRNKNSLRINALRYLCSSQIMTAAFFYTKQTPPLNSSLIYDILFIDYDLTKLLRRFVYGYSFYQTATENAVYL